MAVAEIRITQEGGLAARHTRIYLNDEEITRFVRSFKLECNSNSNGVNLLHLVVVARVDMPDGLQAYIDAEMFEPIPVIEVDDAETS